MGRFLDARGRIFGKVNIVDLIILIVVVAVVVFALVRTTGDSSTMIPIRVTYTVEEVRQGTVDAITTAVQAGATVRDDGGTVLGVIEKAEVHATREEVPTPQGELKAFDSPVFSDVDIVVKGQARLSSSTYRIGSVFMRVGKKVNLVGPGFEVQTVIMLVGEDK